MTVGYSLLTVMAGEQINLTLTDEFLVFFSPIKQVKYHFTLDKLKRYIQF